MSNRALGTIKHRKYKPSFFRGTTLTTRNQASHFFAAGGSQAQLVRWLNLRHRLAFGHLARRGAECFENEEPAEQVETTAEEDEGRCHGRNRSLTRPDFRQD